MLKFFRSTANQRLVARLLRESFREHAFGYGIAIVAMIVVAATTAASAWIMRDITNEFTGAKDLIVIYEIAAFVAVIFIVKGFATFFQTLFLSRAGNAIIADRQRKIYDRMLAHGIEFYHSYSSADLIMRMTQSAQAARGVVDTLVTSFIRDLFSVIGLVAVMAFQQPMLSLVAFVVGPIAIFSVNKLLKRTRKIMQKELASVSRIMRVMQETVFGARIVKSFNLESTMRNRMYEAVADVQKRANSIAALEAVTNPIMETLAGLAIASVVLISGYLVVQGGHTPGSVMAFITALLLCYEPAKRLARARVSLEAGMVGVRMMYEVTDRPLTMEEAPDAKPLADGPGEIRFDDVSFSYRENETVIKDLNIVFPAGKMTALVGVSGGGKSTVLNLIMRLYDPESGRVLFDGQDIKQATLQSLRDKIAYVSQDTFLFDNSVMQNIRMGRQDATDEEVVAAAKAANAHAFIKALPKGYKTGVGENGVLLSGGQKQRISIARAILRNAPILLLDEATSALDAESEALFRDALENLQEGRTTIAIAHRLSTVHRAHKIIVMDAGHAVEQGSHAELLAKSGGIYKKLHEYQLMP
ncbi:MAG: ABC transporter ATP-binding protein [Mesorhizobium sp.]|nr:ABC transporter ATP-binding protein [Mesorhizobium sp.]MBL8579163.1 ABC transporter ATP-binding protein [Mesorhizobium sp.]